MKLANSPGMKKQDRENSKTLKNFMMSQDEYLRLVHKETEEIQCKFALSSNEKNDNFPI